MKGFKSDVADTYLGDLSDPLTLNRYSYTMNNPVMRTDPSGHWPGWLDKAANTVKKGVNTVKNWVNEKVVSPVKNIGPSVKACIRAGGSSAASGSASQKLRQTLTTVGNGLAAVTGATGSVQLGGGRGNGTYAQAKAQEAMLQVIQMQCESGETLDKYTQGQKQLVEWNQNDTEALKNSWKKQSPSRFIPRS